MHFYGAVGVSVYLLSFDFVFTLLFSVLALVLHFRVL